MQVAIYARVSTVDKNQDPETQLWELREYCDRMGWPYWEYVDYAGGAKESRPEYRRLMKDADRRRFDMVLVWSLDRFGRSLKQLVNDLDFLGSKGIDFRSHTQALDTTTPQGKLMFQLLGAFAEIEREMISERVKAGLALARIRGKRLGRPAALERNGITVEDVQKLADQGLSRRQIAQQLGGRISKATVHRVLASQKPPGF